MLTRSMVRPERLPATKPATASTMDCGSAWPESVVTVTDALGLRSCAPKPVGSGMSRKTAADLTPRKSPMRAASSLARALM